MFKSLYITYGDSLTLEYRLRKNPVVERWVEQVLLAQQQYPIDDPQRFYGFGTIESQIEDALTRINNNIKIIKSRYPQIIGNYVSDVKDQDLLNYWHHQFELYHGLLDLQTLDRNDEILHAFADLNVCVHRCESIANGAMPRHVVTYYGLPKTQLLNNSDYQYFIQEWSAGTVFLNYVEIGKTLEDLTNDNDKYIGKDAFRPFRHFSADFNVKFYDRDETVAREKNSKIYEYYKKNIDFFGPWQDCYVGGGFPLANLVNKLDLDAISKNRSVTAVFFK